MNSPTVSRRHFLQAGAAASAAWLAGAPYVRAQNKSGSAPVVLAAGDFKFECQHGWGELPSHIKWGPTHNIAFDSKGFAYIAHQTPGPGLMDSIVVFDPAGKYVRSFGKEYSGGGHGLDLRKEGNNEFLYLSCTKQKMVTKTTLEGELVYAISTPWDSGKYDSADPKKKFVPTNVAFHPTDGGFYIADGYGAYFVHRYDKDGKRIATFGGPGKEHGQLSNPHGLWVDTRPGKEPTLIICDRANHRYEVYSLEGQYQSSFEDTDLPANITTQGDLLLCADLNARVSLYDKNNKNIVHFGYTPEWVKETLADKRKMRAQPERWVAGKFVCPHDAEFDAEGNIFVTEWVETGRVTKMKKLS